MHILLQASEDVEIKDFFLMHLISDKAIVDALSIKQEINGIERVLKKRSLDVAAITIPSKTSLEKMYLKKITDITDISTLNSDDLFNASLKSYITENISELSDVCHEETELGIDLSTEFLFNKSEYEINLLLNSFDEFNENIAEKEFHQNKNIENVDNDSNSSFDRDQPIETLITIESIKTNQKKRIKRISYLSVATNSFTHTNLKIIQEWATRRGK